MTQIADGENKICQFLTHWIYQWNAQIICFHATQMVKIYHFLMESSSTLSHTTSISYLNLLSPSHLCAISFSPTNAPEYSKSKGKCGHYKLTSRAVSRYVVLEFDVRIKIPALSVTSCMITGKSSTSPSLDFFICKLELRVQTSKNTNPYNSEEEIR